MNFNLFIEHLRNSNADSAGGLDFFLSSARKESSFDDNGLGRETSLSKNLEESSLSDVNDRGGGGISGSGLAIFLRNQRPQLLDVDRVAVDWILFDMEVSHTDFTEITGMVFVEVDSVVMLTSGETTTSTVTTLTVLTDTTLTVGHVPTHLSGLLVAGDHYADLTESVRQSKSDSPC